MSTQTDFFDKKKFDKKRLAFFFLPLIIILSLYLSGSNFFSPSNKTWLQIYLYPLVLLGLIKILGTEFKVPKQVLIISTAFALLGVAYAYMYPLKARRGGLVVARLEGDELQNESRIFREQINRALDQNGYIRALSINEGFGSLNDAEDFISKNKKLKILISGNQKWINIFFPERLPLSLSELGLGIKLPGIADLKLHYSVRTIGLSLQPRYATALFIANLAEGVAGYKQDSRNDSFELSLLNAANLGAFWTSFSHKAYPLWFLANIYIESSVKNGKFSRPLLNCGVKAYKKAFSWLRKGDNPDLKASILNNLGVAYALRGYMIGKRRDVKIAKKYFTLAVKVYKEKSKLSRNFSAAVVANENVSLLSAAKHKFGKSKARKKKERKEKKEKKKQPGKKHGRHKKKR
jgi:hypothetical protein